MFRIGIRVQANDEGLRNAERTYVAALNTTLNALGRHLQGALRGRVRRNIGTEARNIKYEVRGSGLAKTLFVFGSLVQLFIDEYGLAPGTFPPWDVGSRLYRYVDKKNLVAREERSEHHNFGVRRRARKVSHVTSRRPRATGAGGTQPSTPPVGTRVKRRRRAAKPGADPQERRRARASATREKATRRLAFLVARAIFERGIKAGRPIARTFESNRAKIVRDIANAFVRATNKINRGQ
jgi:hypothetical protein